MLLNQNLILVQTDSRLITHPLSTVFHTQTWFCSTEMYSTQLKAALKLLRDTVYFIHNYPNYINKILDYATKIISTKDQITYDLPPFSAIASSRYIHDAIKGHMRRWYERARDEKAPVGAHYHPGTLGTLSVECPSCMHTSFTRCALYTCTTRAA